MALTISHDISLAVSTNVPSIPVDVSIIDVQAVEVSLLADCITQISLCVPQAADKTFLFTETSEGDLTGAADIILEVSDDINSATTLITKSLTAGTITLLTDNTFSATIDHADTEALSPGTKYVEVWLTTLVDTQFIMGAGEFNIEDTRKYD